MEKTSFTAINKTFLISSIITFAISFYPKINDLWKIILLVVALALLITTYFFSYTGALDKIEKEIDKLEKQQELNWKILNTLTNNKLLEGINKLLKK